MHNLLKRKCSLKLCSLFCTHNACHFHHTWVVFVQHSIANTLECNLFSRSTQNNEKHEHIECIMGCIMF